VERSWESEHLSRQKTYRLRSSKNPKVREKEAPKSGTCLMAGFTECWGQMRSNGREGQECPNPRADLLKKRQGNHYRLRKEGIRNGGESSDSGTRKKGQNTGALNLHRTQRHPLTRGRGRGRPPVPTLESMLGRVRRTERGGARKTAYQVNTRKKGPKNESVEVVRKLSYKQDRQGGTVRGQPGET